MDRVSGSSVSVTTSSALNPSLVLCLVCLPTGLVGLMLGLETWHLLFGCLTFIPPLLTAAQIVWFTFFDRDRLQNERHVEQKMLIASRQAFGDKAGIFEIPLNSQNLIDNPRLDHGDV